MLSDQGRVDNVITKKEINELKKMACTMRMDVVHMGPRSGNVPHVGPAFSCADIVSALYFHFMNVRPEDPHWEDRDRFVISKGHGALCVYSALAHRGFFSVDELWKIKQVGAMLQGHPDMKKIPVLTLLLALSATACPLLSVLPPP